MLSPYELSVSSGGADTAEALVGGASTVHLSLEYLVDSGASAPSISVTAASSTGSTSTFTETPPATGYQVKRHFMNIEPGTKVTINATDATARLRWCESFCC